MTVFSLWRSSQWLLLWLVLHGMAVPATAADPLVLDAYAGLPRAGLVSGNASSWRNVSMRAENELFTIEMVGRTCTRAARPQAPVGSVPPDGCDDELAPSLRRPLRMAAVWKVPRLPTTGAMIDLGVRTMRVSPHDDDEPRTRVGLDVSLVQPMGRFDAIMGVAAPFGPSRQSSAYLGAAWHLPGAGTFELSADVVRVGGEAGIDRAISVRYRLVDYGGLRFSAGLRRLVDDPVDPWRADVGIDWRF